MICAWHKCRAEFTPDHNRQMFCGPACQSARRSWKQSRGAVLVDLLLDMDAAALAEQRRKIMEEIANG